MRIAEIAWVARELVGSTDQARLAAYLARKAVLLAVLGKSTRSDRPVKA